MFLSNKQNEVSALLMLPGCEAGRSQALVKAEGEVTLKERCKLLRVGIGLVKSIHGNCLIVKCRVHFLKSNLTYPMECYDQHAILVICLLCFTIKHFERAYNSCVVCPSVHLAFVSRP